MNAALFALAWLVVSFVVGILAGRVFALAERVSPRDGAE